MKRDYTRYKCTNRSITDREGRSYIRDTSFLEATKTSEEIRFVDLILDRTLYTNQLTGYFESFFSYNDLLMFVLSLSHFVLRSQRSVYKYMGFWACHQLDSVHRLYITTFLLEYDSKYTEKKKKRVFVCLKMYRH